jgi:hypothetical protein
MHLFGNNFLDIRNNNIIPLVNYGISRTKYQFWSIKDVITQNIISINKLEGKTVEIEVNKSDYYKALHCDIELFMNKSIIQYSDFSKSKINSPCWSFITLYYLAFFSTTCFFRYLNKGFIFLTTEQKKRIEYFSLAVHSSPISLDSGNYYFNYKEENANGNIVISLSFKGESVHKLNWIQLENTLRDFLPNCDNDEKAIYKTFLSHFSNFKSEFPSNLRNKLNYNGESSILDLENSVSYIDFQQINANFIKGLFNIDTKFSIKNQINSIGYLASYLFKFNTELYKEYLDRSKFGKDFNKERNSYLLKNKVAF